MPSKKRKPQTKRRKGTGSSSIRLVPFKENMGTGESYTPKKRKVKRPQPVPVRHPLEGLEVLELEELTRPAVIPVDIEDSALRRFLKALVYYGLWSAMILALATIVAWYALEKNRKEPVRMLRSGRSVIFAVGEETPSCRVIVETEPTSSAISINATPIFSRTPVKLILPCQKTAVLSLTADGFLPVAQLLRPHDKQLMHVRMINGASTITDDVKFNFINAVQPFLTLFNW